MATPVTVGVVQADPTVGNVEANRCALDDATADIVAAGADFIVLPELANTGCVFETREEAFELAEPADGPTISAWCETVADAGIWLVGGFAERDGNTLYNSAAVVSPDGLETVYRKVPLWDREHLFLRAGRRWAPHHQHAVWALRCACL
ncbi:aliphatic amidase amiE [Halarchaeum acidiphilum MH1-52-1]|uniref:Aliphatic amidase amiE n=1 Tax=Halarchaeum acidiphilum MH1-52-1 TaxID=1261545 RepID=U3AAR7_9EURY|nr:aliphatic amidase amiE [Halarchaeum acidiphilum MH1-52-1]